MHRKQGTKLVSGNKAIKYVVIAIVIGTLLGSSGLMANLFGLIAEAAGLYAWVFAIWFVLVFTQYSDNRFCEILEKCMHPMTSLVGRFNWTGSVWFAPIASFVILVFLAHLV